MRRRSLPATWSKLKKKQPGGPVSRSSLRQRGPHRRHPTAYKRDAQRGKNCGSAIVDPCWPHDDLMGDGNFKIITRPDKPDKEFSEYWLKARPAARDVYPGRKDRGLLRARRQTRWGTSSTPSPIKPVKDDSELVHKDLQGARPPPRARKKEDSKAPAPSCPPRTGVPRIPFSLDRLRAGHRLPRWTALYHQTERGPGRVPSPLGDSGLFHCGAPPDARERFANPGP